MVMVMMMMRRGRRCWTLGRRRIATDVADRSGSVVRHVSSDVEEVLSRVQSHVGRGGSLLWSIEMEDRQRLPLTSVIEKIRSGDSRHLQTSTIRAPFNLFDCQLAFNGVTALARDVLQCDIVATTPFNMTTRSTSCSVFECANADRTISCRHEHVIGDGMSPECEYSNAADLAAPMKRVFNACVYMEKQSEILKPALTADQLHGCHWAHRIAANTHTLMMGNMWRMAKSKIEASVEATVKEMIDTTMHQQWARLYDFEIRKLIELMDKSVAWGHYGDHQLLSSCIDRHCPELIPVSLLRDKILQITGSVGATHYQIAPDDVPIALMMPLIIGPDRARDVLRAIHYDDTLCMDPVEHD